MKKHLLTGLVILLPVALTLMIILFLFDLFTEPFFTIVNPLIEQLQDKIHISLPKGVALFLSRLLSLIFLCISIFFLGLFTQLFLVKTLMRWGGLILNKIPLIKTVYRVSKEILSALFSIDGKKVFKKPIFTPFPAKFSRSIGFEAGEVAKELKSTLGEDFTTVFVPTAPHPISGFLFIVPKADLEDSEFTNEEALKFLVSCGMIVPESKESKPKS